MEEVKLLIGQRVFGKKYVCGILDSEEKIKYIIDDKGSKHLVIDETIEEQDIFFDDAKNICNKENKISCIRLERAFKVNYYRAEKIITQLIKFEIVKKINRSYTINTSN